MLPRRQDNTRTYGHLLCIEEESGAVAAGSATNVIAADEESNQGRISRMGGSRDSVIGSADNASPCSLAQQLGGGNGRGGLMSGLYRSLCRH